MARPANPPGAQTPRWIGSSKANPGLQRREGVGFSFGFESFFKQCKGAGAWKGLDVREIWVYAAAVLVLGRNRGDDTRYERTWKTATFKTTNLAKDG